MPGGPGSPHGLDRLRRDAGDAAGASGAALALLLEPAGAALGLALLRALAVYAPCAQRVSLCGVCFPHQRQYLRNSTRSGLFRFDFSVW